MSDKKLSKGDKVEWNSHGSKAEGTVEKKITSDTHAAKRDVKASKDDPQYLVKSDKSGGEGGPKPHALREKGTARRAPQSWAAGKKRAKSPPASWGSGWATAGRRREARQKAEGG